MHSKLQSTAIALLLIAVAFLLYRDQQREKRIDLLLANQSLSRPANGRPARDPYLKNQVKNRIIKGYPDIQKCYQEYLTADPPLTDGHVKMDWQIDTDGDVIRPEVVLSPFQDKTLHKCLAARIQTWNFPPPPVRKYVSHTFKFEKK